MAKLTPRQAYAAYRRAGFTAPAAITMTAISIGESRLDPTATGDEALADAVWGPSVGIPQIRTLRSETGKGTARDIQALRGSVRHQAEAAYQISNEGRNFGPWTVYSSGGYLQHMAAARAAAAAVGEGWAAEQIPGYLGSSGALEGSGAIGAALQGVAVRVRDIATEGLVAVGGVVLVIVGGSVAVREARRRA